jgi:hypothetical protein
MCIYTSVLTTGVKAIVLCSLISVSNEKLSHVDRYTAWLSYYWRRNLLPVYFLTSSFKYVYFLKCLLFKSASRSAKLALRNENDFVQSFVCIFFSPEVRLSQSRTRFSSPTLLRTYKFNVCYGSFSEIAASPILVAQATQLPLRRYHGLRTCIPGLEETFDRTMSYIDMLNSYRYQVLEVVNYCFIPHTDGSSIERHDVSICSIHIDTKYWYPW